MQAAAGPTYYADPSKFVQPIPASPYMMPACVNQQGGVSWAQQYVNGSPVLVPVYTVTPPQPMQYYQHQPMYINAPAEAFYPQQGSYAPHQALSNRGSPVNVVANQGGRPVPLGTQLSTDSSGTITGSEFYPASKIVSSKTASQKTKPRQMYISPKREVLRYESADSGIADSPPSVSSPVWSGDESLEDSDGFESKAPRGSGNESDTSKDNDEDCWSIQDDAAYWARLGQSGPGPFVASAIAKQVEYYLSDEYLVKDKYLLRQIRCKKDGYVSIKLITSFKKVKKLTRDWQVVRSAIARHSQGIVVSPEGLRIRRRTKLSENLRKPRLLTSVLVIRLPDDYNSVEKVTSLFRNFGEISFVRLLRANKEVPADLRNYATQVHDIGTSLCGVIDFECSEDALNAVRVVKHLQKEKETGGEEKKSTDEGEPSIPMIEKYRQALKKLPSLGDIRLALLGPRVRRTLYRQDRTADLAEEQPQDDAEAETSPDDVFTPTDDKIPEIRRRSSADDGVKADSRLLFLAEAAKEPYSRSLPKNFGASCSWLSQRRSAALNHSQQAVPRHVTHVIRMPRGPDDTPGFRLKRTVQN